jgi:hypothetical protein
VGSGYYDVLLMRSTRRPEHPATPEIEEDPMSFVAANTAYEAWLRRQCAVVDKDLRAKHKKMANSAFDFLRATFFRWARTISKVCPDLARSKTVISVGDIHVENFGTWRDVEGRLVWGVNDFDEAAEIPFALDLVRLATSARLAPDRRISSRDIADAILDGYLRGLQAPRPTLLDEQETWMRPFVACSDEERTKFWKEVDGYPAPEHPVPEAVERGLRHSLPPGAGVERFATRRKGGGSLGRPRYVAIACWRGGRVVREAKALVISAWDWAHGTTGAPNHFEQLATGPHRSPDPFLAVKDAFIFRRVAADSRKVEFGPDAGLALHHNLLRAMGFELGTIHASAGATDAIRHDFDRLPSGWLRSASGDAAASVEADYDEWKRHADRGEIRRAHE